MSVYVNAVVRRSFPMGIRTGKYCSHRCYINGRFGGGEDASE